MFYVKQSHTILHNTSSDPIMGSHTIMRSFFIRWSDIDSAIMVCCLSVSIIHDRSLSPSPTTLPRAKQERKKEEHLQFGVVLMIMKTRRESVDLDHHGDSLEHTRLRLQEISDMKEEWRLERENNLTLFQQPCRTLHLCGELLGIVCLLAHQQHRHNFLSIVSAIDCG